MRKIKVGIKDGCEVFIERTGYYHNEKDQSFEIYAEKFCETSTGVKFWNDEIPIVVKNFPEEWAWDINTSIPVRERNGEKEIIKRIVHEATEDYTEMLSEYVQGFEHFDIFLDDFLTQKFKTNGK